MTQCLHHRSTSSINSAGLWLLRTPHCKKTSDTNRGKTNLMTPAIMRLLGKGSYNDSHHQSIDWVSSLMIPTNIGMWPLHYRSQDYCKGEGIVSQPKAPSCLHLLLLLGYDLVGLQLLQLIVDVVTSSLLALLLQISILQSHKKKPNTCILSLYHDPSPIGQSKLQQPLYIHKKLLQKYANYHSSISRL